MLNKTILSDVSKINEERIEKSKNIYQLITANFILHMNQAQIQNLQNVKRENKQKTLQEAKNTFENLKIDTKILLFSEENLNTRLLKKLKNLVILRTSCC